MAEAGVQDWWRFAVGVRLEMVCLPRLSESVAYVSQLLAPVSGPREILVAMPIHACRYVVWPVGTKLAVSMIDPGHGVWRFQASVLENGQTGRGLERIRTCTLGAESGLVRCQRRSDFRVECRVDVRLRAIAATESTDIPNDETNHPVEGITQNLSAGGACVLTIDPPPATGMVELTLALPLPDGRRIRTRCRTIRCEPDSRPGQRRYRLALQFTNLSNADQGMLVQCLQRLQIRQRNEPGHP